MASSTELAATTPVRALEASPGGDSTVVAERDGERMASFRQSRHAGELLAQLPLPPAE